jgi:hypothetical protein
VAYTRGDHTEAEMIADMAYRAEKHMLDDRGPFFVLRIYFETGEYRQEIDAVIGSTGSHRSRDGPKSPLRAALAWSAALSDCGIGYGLRATGYGGRGRAANDSP